MSGEIEASSSLRELSARAKVEIGEADVDVEDELDNLKGLLEVKYEGLRLPPSFDDFLMRCLRTRKFDVSRAARLVSQYFKLMAELSDMQSCMMPSRYPNLYRGLAVSMLKFRDSRGCAVVLARQERCPPSEYTFDESLAASLLLIDEVVRCSVDTQRLGLVFVCDWNGYGLAHFRQTSPSRLKTAAKLFQDAFPVRFKAFHFIRNPFLVSCMFAVVRPFLKEKLKNRIHFHGHDLESFHNYLSPDILPEYLGGKLPDEDYADMDLVKRLMERDEYYKDIFTHGYIKRSSLP